MDKILNIKLATDAGNAAGGGDDGEAPPAEITAGRMKSTAGSGRKAAAASNSGIDLGGLNDSGNLDTGDDEFSADDTGLPAGDASDTDGAGDDAGAEDVSEPVVSDADRARYVELLGTKKVERMIRLYGDKAKDMLDGEVEDIVGDVDPDAELSAGNAKDAAKPLELASDLTLEPEAVTELRNVVGGEVYDKTLKPLVDHVGKVSALAKQMQTALAASQQAQQKAENDLRRMQVHGLMDALGDERIGRSIYAATPEQMAMRQQVGALAGAIQAKRNAAGQPTSDRQAIAIALQKLGSSVPAAKAAQMDRRQQQVGRVPSQTVRPSVPKRGEQAAIRAADNALRRMGQL